MKIKIDSDVHDIVDRIKDIDEGYYIVFDTTKNKYELHNYNQLDSYCLTIPYDNIYSRILSLVMLSSVSNMDNIMEEIDNNNTDIENKCIKHIKDVADYKLREIYKFVSNSSKCVDYDKTFMDNWR